MNQRTESGAPHARETIGSTLMDAMPAEQRLLAAVAEPQNVGVNVRELCRRAGISPDTYYRLMGQQRFHDRLRKSRQESLGDISAQIEALKTSALLPGRDGAQDRKTLFTMSGHLPDRTLKMEPPDEVEVRPKLMPLSHLLWCYMQVNFPRERWMPAVRDQYETGVLQPEMPPLPTIGNPYYAGEGEGPAESAEDTPAPERLP
jgi:transposase-like protein